MKIYFPIIFLVVFLASMVLFSNSSPALRPELGAGVPESISLYPIELHSTLRNNFGVELTKSGDLLTVINYTIEEEKTVRSNHIIAQKLVYFASQGKLYRWDNNRWRNFQGQAGILVLKDNKVIFLDYGKEQ